MPDRALCLERLRALFLEHFHVEVPSDDTDLLETGVLDSLQLVDLLLLVEQTFGRRIDLESVDLENLRSLARLAKLVATPVPVADNVREILPARRGSSG